MVVHSKGVSCVLKQSLFALIPKAERTPHAVNSSAPTKMTEDTTSILQILGQLGVVIT